MMYRRIFLLVIMGWIGTENMLLAQNKPDYGALDKYIQSAVDDYNLPGLAIAIVKDDKVVFEKGYGKRNLGKLIGRGKVDENTTFAIASQSKAYTATALAMLVDEGKLSWDDHVTDLLPGFRLHRDAATAMLRVRDLLCHRVGLNTFDGDLLWYGTGYSRTEVLRRIRHLPLKQTFRGSYGYQNVMFLAGGQLIPKVANQSWDAFVQQRIFAPLNMRRSTTTAKGFQEQNNIAFPHIDREVQGFLSYDNIGPAASLHSSVADITQWMRFWLNDGIVNGDTLLSPALIREMLEVQNPLAVGAFDKRNDTHFKGYGLGWFLMDYAGRKVAHHGGGLPGYISKVMIVPEEDLGMVVLTNDMNSLPTALMYKVLDVHLKANADDRDWAQFFLDYSKRSEKRKIKARKKEEKARVKNTSPSHETIAYAGQYLDPYYGKATVDLVDDELRLVLEPADELFNATLEHWHYDTFRFQFQDPFLPQGFVTFDIDPDGQINSFTIKLDNPDFHFYNLDFERVE